MDDAAERRLLVASHCMFKRIKSMSCFATLPTFYLRKTPARL